MLAISTGVAEAEAEEGEGVIVAEAGTVELKTSEGSSFGQFESGVPVAVGISESVVVAEIVELRVSVGSSKSSGVAVAVGPP